MSDALPLALAICAFIFSFLALGAAATAAIIVIGWSRSTHKVIQVPTEDPLTRYEYDLPAEVLDKRPSDPNPPTPEEYVRRMQRAEAALDDQFSQDW